jgi:RNA polymerase sigma factor (sigma-70 family)
LGVVVALRLAQRDNEVAQIQRDTGMEISDEDLAYAEGAEQDVRQQMLDQGFSRERIAEAERNVWNALKYDASKAARKLLRNAPDIGFDEVVAEAAVKAYMNIDKYSGNSRLSTWVFKITSSIINSLMTRSRASGIGKGRFSIPGGATGRGGLGLGIMYAPKGRVAGRAELLQDEAAEESEDVEAYTEGEYGGATMFSRRYLTPEERREQEAEIIEEYNLGESRRRRSAQQAEIEAEIAAQKAYAEAAASGVIGEEQDAIITKFFAQLPPQFQQILQLRATRGTYQMPDGSQIEVTEGFSQTRMAEILGVPKGTVQSRLGRAREKLVKLAGGRLKPPYVGALAQAYFGDSPQGSVATVAPTGEVKKIEHVLVAGAYPMRGRGGVVRREARTNPYVEGTEFYYENANDLLDLWLDGDLTQEQFDVCMAALEAEVGVAL